MDKKGQLVINDFSFVMLQFGFCFVYDASKVCNELLVNIRCVTFLPLFGRILNLISSQKPTHPWLGHIFPIVSAGPRWQSGNILTSHL